MVSRRISAILTSAAMLCLLPSAPVAAQRTKQWAADWSRCISHDPSTNRLRNTCTQDMNVHWEDVGGHWNFVTIRANGYYEGGGRPRSIYACLALPQNRFDRDERRCYYWE